MFWIHVLFDLTLKDYHDYLLQAFLLLLFCP